MYFSMTLMFLNCALPTVEEPLTPETLLAAISLALTLSLFIIDVLAGTEAVLTRTSLPAVKTEPL
jgi:hypothetical protein